MSLPAGTIVIWHGAIVDIPAGFHLCDGTSGTPDLRNKFIVGAGGTYFPDDTGGTETHSHTVATFGHTHELVAGAHVQGGDEWTKETTSKTLLGTTNTVSHMPLYMALCYIMRV